MEIIIAIGGVIIGALIAWLTLRQVMSSTTTRLQSENQELEKEVMVLNDRLQYILEEKQKTEQVLAEEQKLHGQNMVDLAKKEQELVYALERLKNQKAELEDIQKKFTLEFENIASKILKVNSKEFTELNLTNIGNILNPLKEKIEKFEKKVDETYEKGFKDQENLRFQLKQLYELNNKISEEANNLTRALKSDTKKLGNWGELILERILEQSGLVKGEEYYSQYSDHNDQGDAIRPDVVVLLPDKKHIIIDSKVSLVAYDQYVNSGENDKEEFLKAHLDSVKDHIKGLSEKNYQTATSLDSPDFVLLFMPIEPAFHLAIQNDPELFYYAWQRKIVIVSPTTLLATLKTVESIWKHEKQTRNAMEIAHQGKSMLDKLNNFLADMEKLGSQIDVVRGTYDQAYKRLATGKGNLVSQARKLKDLGVKAEKSLPEKFIVDGEESE